MNLQVKPTTALYIHMHSLHGLPILDHSLDIGDWSKLVIYQTFIYIKTTQHSHGRYKGANTYPSTIDLPLLDLHELILLGAISAIAT